MSRQDAELRPKSKPRPSDRAGGDVHASSLLAKGSLLLESLTLKAEAARAEADKAQLQLLMEKAEAGDLAPLQEWLEQRGEENGSEQIFDVAHVDSPDSDSIQPVAASDTVDAFEQSGWDSEQGRAWLAASRARLGISGSARQTRPNPPSKDSASTELEAAGLDSKNATVAKKGSSENTQDAGQPKSAGKAEKSEPKVSKEVLAAVSDVLASEQSEATGVKKSRLAGIAASVIAHVLLLVILAVVTLKLPTDAAGLSFQSTSSETIEPVMEVVQEVSAEVPESQETAEVSEPVVDASDALSDIQADMSDSLDQVQLQTPGTSASSMMSATSAASSNLPSGEATSFFGAAAGGNNFCYVIDASGSMRGGPWQAAKFELLKSLAGLKPNQRYYIVCFNRELSPMVLDGPDPEPTPVYATPDNLQKTRRWLETVEIGIGAPPNKALEYAIDLETDAIYFLSDGVTKVDVAAFLREVNQVESLFGDVQIRVPIHPIAYYSLDGQALLRQIAAENRGQFIYVPDPTK